jgi:glycosyltransferase involved in cell wall biosynthesis
VIRLGQKSFETIRKGGLRALGSRLKSCGITDSRTDYTEWIRRYDTLDDPARGIIRDRIAEMDNPPRISIVMPVYNPEPRFLAEAVKSVQNQLYPHWELCIADDASTDENIRPLLERYALEDDRIRVVFRKENGHISEASNSALALATGEFVALLDNDDILSEVALFCVAKEILKKPEIALIYSDEDKIDTKNRRFAPYFKSDFNYDLFLSQNMVSHLGVYRRDLVETVGAFRTEMVGAQDYDLALRIIDIIDYSQIFHIPKVLYHWRVHPESTAQTADAKPYAMIAGERAINEHLKRNKINASAELLGWGYRVKYELPENIPLVSIVIPTKNNYLVLKKCIESILGNTSYSNYEVIIVDNGSNECKTLEYLSVLQKKVRFSVIRDESEFNYSYLNNKAVKISLGEVICLLNDDIEIIDAGWLTELVSIAMQPNVGVVGARLWYPDNSIQHAGVILGLGVHRVAGHAHYRAPKGNYGYFGRAALMQSFSAVTGACMVVRKSIYEMVGGLDEDLAVAFNDVDFCLRVGNKGYRVVWTPYAEMIHHESVSRGVEDSPEKVARFKREIQKMQLHWGDTLLNDPAYSPNLTLDHEDFSLAWPPRKN